MRLVGTYLLVITIINHSNIMLTVTYILKPFYEHIIAGKETHGRCVLASI